MAEIRSFNATRYSKALEPTLADLLTPPYDVISPEMQKEFYDRHEKNLVRIDFGAEAEGDDARKNKYSRAADLLKHWKNEGTLVRDAKPAIYIYEQEFDLEGKGRIRRRGFFCAVRLEDLSEGIRAHERTFEGPKADRLRLTQATNANISPVFCIFEDEARQADTVLARWADAREPTECSIEGIVHRLWVMDAAAAVEELSAVLSDKRLFIADGHHRYETALNYRKEQSAKAGTQNGPQPFDYTLMFLANTHADGMEILPTHRVLTSLLATDVDTQQVLERLGENFEITELANIADADASARDYTERLKSAGENAASFVLLLPPDKAYLLSLRPEADPSKLVADPAIIPEVKKLDVTILHKYIIENVWLGPDAPEPGHDDIVYVKGAAETVAMVKSGQAEAAFLLNPTPMEQVTGIAGLGVRMPQKSTYFYPKIITGMVIREMD